MSDRDAQEPAQPDAGATNGTPGDPQAGRATFAQQGPNRAGWALIDLDRQLQEARATIAGLAQQRDTSLDQQVQAEAVIAALRADLEAARRERDEAKDIANNLVFATELHAKAGQYRATLEGDGVKAFCGIVGEAFHRMGGTNYVEVHLADADGVPYTLTFQKTTHPTPHGLKVQAEARVREVEAENARLRAALLRASQDLRTVGDDYPGSSCHLWCHTRADAADSALLGREGALAWPTPAPETCRRSGHGPVVCTRCGAAYVPVGAETEGR